MKKQRAIINIVVAFVVLGAAFALTYQPTTGAGPDIPTIVDQLDLGVPAGNGHGPQRLALDSERRQLYTLNNGLAELNEGNTISIVDLSTNQVTALLRLDNQPPPDPLQPALSRPAPLDLQVDPYRPRLYALTGDPYASPPTSNLAMIDLDAQRILDTLPGILAVASGPERLYLASATRLWAADPASLTELFSFNLQSQRDASQSPISNLQSPISNPQPLLLLNAEANRLYLAEKQSGALTVFAADSLEVVDSYTGPAQLVDAVIDEAGQRVWLIDGDGTQLTLRALTGDGQPLTTPAPLVLTNDIYSDPHLALAGLNLIVTSRSIDSFLLQIFNRSSLALVASMTIPDSPTDLSADPATGQLYLTYSDTHNSYILTLDPASGAAETIFTALTISDALADPETGRLYVLNSERTLQALSLTDYSEMTRLDLKPKLNCGDTAGCLPADRNIEPALALDPTRQRLYLSGDPAQVIDAVSFTVTAALDTPGQLTPNPANDQLYLTPPCQCGTGVCNTLVLNSDTFTGTSSLFPAQDPLTAPCVIGTTLDPENQVLYALIYNGVPGSNSGNTFSVFDVAGPPQPIYDDGQISYAEPALDPERGRAFMTRYRPDRSFIHRFDRQGQTLTPTLELAGANGALTYDPSSDRLYAVADATLRVFDGDLTLLSEISLPGLFKPLTFDSQAQRLYLTDANGSLLVVAASGGQLERPSQPVAGQQVSTPPQLFVAPSGDYFRIDNSRLYRADGQSWQILGHGLPGRSVQAFAISPNYEADNTLLAGLSAQDRNGGLYRSTDGGATWQPATRGLTDLEISQIVFSPTFAQDQTIFLTTAYRGLFRSTDGGDTWQGLADRYATDPADAQLSHLAVSPNFAADKLLFIAYHTLLRSSDGGETWTDTGLPPGKVAFSPDFARDDLVLSDGRWRSTDGGQTWQPAAAGLEPNQGVQSLFFSPTFAGDQTVYIVLYQNFDQPLKLQRSVDAGRTWQSLLGGLPADFALAAATILPSYELFLSDRGGEQLTVVPDYLRWGRPPLDLTQLDLQAMTITPDGAIFVANSIAGVLKSADEGRTWQDTEFPARADETKIAQLALAGDDTLFAAVGTIIERNDDPALNLDEGGGQTWSYLANLPAGFEVTALAVSPDFANDGIVLAGGNYATRQLLRSVDRGQTWQVVYDGSTVGGAADVGVVTFSPNFARDETVYAWLQYGGLLRSTDGGQTWALTPNDKSGEFAQTLAISPDGRQLYLGTLYGGLYVSDDGGQSWLDLTTDIPGPHTWNSVIIFGPANSVFLGTDVGVYRSLDGGQIWTHASAGLPVDPNLGTPVSVRALAFSGNQLYAALTQGGLYVSDDQGQSWDSAAAH